MGKFLLNFTRFNGKNKQKGYQYGKKYGQILPIE